MPILRRVILIAALPLGACTARQDLVDGRGVTLTQAMRETVDALAATKDEGAIKKTNFGIYACTVTAEYKVAAVRTADDKIALGVSGGPPAAVAPVSVSLTGSQETNDQGSRSSNVTLVLATPWCFPNGGASAAKAAGAANKGDNAGGKGDGKKAPAVGKTTSHDLSPDEKNSLILERYNVPLLRDFPKKENQLFDEKSKSTE